MRRIPRPASTGVVLAATLLVGCTTQAWYESARVSAEQRCREQPPGAQEECFARLNQKTYEDYRRERDEAPRKAP